MIWLVIRLLIELEKFLKFTAISSETIKNEPDKEILKGRYISLEKERQVIIDELKLNSIIMEYQKVTKVSKNLQQNNS